MVALHFPALHLPAHDGFLCSPRGTNREHLLDRYRPRLLDQTWVLRTKLHLKPVLQCPIVMLECLCLSRQLFEQHLAPEPGFASVHTVPLQLLLLVGLSNGSLKFGTTRPR